MVDRVVLAVKLHPDAVVVAVPIGVVPNMRQGPDVPLVESWVLSLGMMVVSLDVVVVFLVG